MTAREKDFFRETWARYLGYANEVGESFRAVVPVGVVRASYAVAFAYVLADTGDKSWKMYKYSMSMCFQTGARPGRVLHETGDALLWQTLASVVVPGLVINRICAFSQKQLKTRYSHIPKSPRNLLTVAIGLVSIPLIIQPIDHGVTLLMDLTYRKLVD